MTRHERLLENYEDAYFALLMEDVAQMEGARLDQLNTWNCRMILTLQFLKNSQKGV